MHTIADDCARVAESGLESPFEGRHMDFPQNCWDMREIHGAPKKFENEKLVFNLCWEPAKGDLKRAGGGCDSVPVLRVFPCQTQFF